MAKNAQRLVELAGLKKEVDLLRGMVGELTAENEALKAAAVSRETAPAKKTSAGARRQEG